MGCFKRIAVVTLALSLGVGCGANRKTSQNDSIFLEPSQASSVQSDADDHPAVRERQVDVNLASVYELSSISSKVERATLGSNRIPLNMFSDTQLDFDVDRVEEVTADNMILSGRINGDPDSAATLVMKDGIMVGNISANGRKFEIRSKKDGSHRIRELDTNVDSACDADRLPAETETADTASPGSTGFQTSSVGNIHTIDILVAYTPSALRAAGSTTAMEALIQMAVTDTDLAFRDSGIPHRARLVGILPVKQEESGNWSTDINALRGTSDGKWDEVHAARIKAGADQVSLVISQSGSTAGIGYIGPSKSSMFTISKTSAFGQYTFSHEIGHNLSLQHSDGLESSAGRFRTIMAYGSLPRIRRFSNPSLAYNGAATGTSSNNSVGKLLKSIPIAGAYLAAISPEPGAHGTTSPAPAPTPNPAPTPAPTPTPAPSPGMASGFVMVDGMGRETSLTDGGRLTYGPNDTFAIVAKTANSVTSVRFAVKIARSGFSSTRSFTDSSAPFVALSNQTANPGLCTITGVTSGGSTMSLTITLERSQ